MDHRCRPARYATSSAAAEMPPGWRAVRTASGTSTAAASDTRTGTAGLGAAGERYDVGDELYCIGLMWGGRAVEASPRVVSGGRAAIRCVCRESGAFWDATGRWQGRQLRESRSGMGLEAAGPEAEWGHRTLVDWGPSRGHQPIDTPTSCAGVTVSRRCGGANLTSQNQRRCLASFRWSDGQGVPPSASSRRRQRCVRGRTRSGYAGVHAKAGGSWGGVRIAWRDSPTCHGRDTRPQ